MGINFASVLILISFVSFLLVLTASIKLIRAKNVPGSKLIFVAIICAILTIFIPGAEYDDKVNLIIEFVEIGIDSILMLMASFGFLRLANFIVSNSANNTLAQTLVK